MNDEKKTTADRLIVDWIEERGEFEELGAPDGDRRGQELLAMLAAGFRAAAPEMSERDAGHVFERVRSQISRKSIRSMIAGPAWLTWAAVIAALAAGLAGWSAGSAGGRVSRTSKGEKIVPIKQVLFESMHDGKAVRFEMQVYRTQGNVKEIPHVPTP